ncbi:hypothetical protein KM043_004605 [Ampulex compressa]|nr:hypothetical protein KM043_004605 [Ampulex compressa]
MVSSALAHSALANKKEEPGKTASGQCLRLEAGSNGCLLRAADSRGAPSAQDGRAMSIIERSSDSSIRGKITDKVESTARVVESWKRRAWKATWNSRGEEERGGNEMAPARITVGLKKYGGAAGMARKGKGEAVDARSKGKKRRRREELKAEATRVTYHGRTSEVWFMEMRESRRGEDAARIVYFPIADGDRFGCNIFLRPEYNATMLMNYIMHAILATLPIKKDD